MLPIASESKAFVHFDPAFVHLDPFCVYKSLSFASTIHSTSYKMENRRKKYIRIEQFAESDEVFAILDSIESDTESDIENMLEDSDTEFVSDEPLPETLSDHKHIMIPEANVHVAGDGQPPRKKKKAGENGIKWQKKNSPHSREPCTLEATVLHEYEGEATPITVFSQASNAKPLINLLVEQSVIYAQQNGRPYDTTVEEMSAFIGMNYIMGINKLPKIHSYWETDSYIGNQAIKNIMPRERFKAILQNLHFTNNQTADISDKGKSKGYIACDFTSIYLFFKF